MNPDTEQLVRDAYLHALALDADNRPARFNLTVLDLHTSDADRKRLLKTLEDLRARSRRPPGPGVVSDAVRWLRDRIAGVRGVQADPLWWQTTYATAAEHAYTAAAIGRDEGGDVFDGAAAKVAREGVVAGLRVLGRPAWLRTPIAAFVADATPPLAVLYAGVASPTVNPDRESPRAPRKRRAVARRLSEKLSGGDGDELVALVRSLPLAPRTRYNLACLYARFDRYEEAITEFLEAAPGLDRELLDWALRDPSLSPVYETVRYLAGAEVDRRDRVKRVATMTPAEELPLRTR